jgi:putative salt-induced outer membrane protein YdiY
MSTRRTSKLGWIAGLIAVVALPVLAQDEPELGWSDVAELGYVATSGNAESSSLGFKNLTTRRWERSLFELSAGGVRVESTSETSVVDAANPPAIIVLEDTEVTAENYFLTGRYDHEITEKFFWFGGAGWDRNEPAGVQNRYTAFGGVGNIWWDREDVKFRTDYAASITKQENVVDPAGYDDTFPGLRLSWSYLNKLGENTEYVNTLVVDDNLDDTSDWRADMVNSVAVAMSDRLALKVSLQWLYDNEPSFELLTATSDSAGNPVAPVSQLVELDELDSILTASLVAKF